MATLFFQKDCSVFKTFYPVPFCVSFPCIITTPLHSSNSLPGCHGDRPRYINRPRSGEPSAGSFVHSLSLTRRKEHISKLKPRLILLWFYPFLFFFFPNKAEKWNLWGLSHSYWFYKCLGKDERGLWRQSWNKRWLCCWNVGNFQQSIIFCVYLIQTFTYENEKHILTILALLLLDFIQDLLKVEM